MAVIVQTIDSTPGWKFNVGSLKLFNKETKNIESSTIILSKYVHIITKFDKTNLGNCMWAFLIQTKSSNNHKNILI